MTWIATVNSSVFGITYVIDIVDNAANLVKAEGEDNSALGVVMLVEMAD